MDGETTADTGARPGDQAAAEAAAKAAEEQAAQEAAAKAAEEQAAQEAAAKAAEEQAAQEAAAKAAAEKAAQEAAAKEAKAKGGKQPPAPSPVRDILAAAERIVEDLAPAGQIWLAGEDVLPADGVADGDYQAEGSRWRFVVRDAQIVGACRSDHLDFEGADIQIVA